MCVCVVNEPFFTAYLILPIPPLIPPHHTLQALQDADTCLELSEGKNVKAWYRKGQALEGQGRSREALEAYHAGLALAPSSSQLLQVFSVHLHMMHLKKARTHAWMTRNSDTAASSHRCFRFISRHAHVPALAGKRTC